MRKVKANKIYDCNILRNTRGNNLNKYDTTISNIVSLQEKRPTTTVKHHCRSPLKTVVETTVVKRDAQRVFLSSGI